MLEMQGASLMKLKAVYAELEKSMKELGKTLVEQKVDSSICLDVVDAVVQEWSLEVNKAMSELKSYEVRNFSESRKCLTRRCKMQK